MTFDAFSEGHFFNFAFCRQILPNSGYFIIIFIITIMIIIETGTGYASDTGWQTWTGCITI